MKDRHKKKTITKQSFFSARGMTKIFMLICMLGFAMPFMTVSCGSQTIENLSGFDVCMGKTIFAFDRLVTTPTEPMIMLAFALSIVILAAAFLPNYPISRPIWGLASLGGAGILVGYLLTAGEKLQQQANAMVSYELPAKVSALPGSGIVLCILCFLASFVMLIRKLFFEEPDLLVLTPDEREVYEAIKAEEKAGEAERAALRRELDEKRKPIIRAVKEEPVAMPETKEKESGELSEEVMETKEGESSELPEKIPETKSKDSKKATKSNPKKTE